MSEQILVIGNGMVGHHFVATLMRSGSGAVVTVVGEESRIAYDRVHLSEVFAGSDPEDLALSSAQEYADWGVDLILGDRAVTIDRERRVVVTESGRELSFDILVLATGSYPFVPSVPGHDQAGCMVYRTLDDLERIRATAARSRIGVVVGGGLLGLECANAVKNLGLETHVVEFAPGLMGVQLDDGASSMLRRKIEDLGVRVHTRRNTQRIVAGESTTLRLEFDDGQQLSTDMVVFSAGIRPRDELARSSGLDIGERGGIVIDEQCRSSDPGIYAIGECALYKGRIFGLMAPGYRMAEVVAGDVAGISGSFTGADMSTKLKLLGVDVGGIGDAHGRSEGSVALLYADRKAATYKRLVVSSDGRRLLGAALVGDCSDYDTLLQYYLHEIELPEDPAGLIVPNGDAAISLDALPPSAAVCRCHNVSKAQIIAAIEAGSGSLAAVKKATCASTGCGGCAALVQQLVDDHGADMTVTEAEVTPLKRAKTVLAEPSRRSA
ncbi:MAG: FAD-dependent oxidoreductase [Pseudomonadota bacterium]